MTHRPRRPRAQVLGAGAIPVYLGAPNWREFFPAPDAVIDAGGPAPRPAPPRPARAHARGGGQNSTRHTSWQSISGRCWRTPRVWMRCGRGGAARSQPRRGRWKLSPSRTISAAYAAGRQTTPASRTQASAARARAWHHTRQILFDHYGTVYMHLWCFFPRRPRAPRRAPHPAPATARCPPRRPLESFSLPPARSAACLAPAHVTRLPPARRPAPRR